MGAWEDVYKGRSRDSLLNSAEDEGTRTNLVATFHLTDALNQQMDAANRLAQRIESLNRWLLIYTFVLALLAAFQVGGLIHDWTHLR
jgi:hypothetical protein